MSILLANTHGGFGNQLKVDALELVLEQTNSTVVRGPFAGMVINPTEEVLGSGLIVGQGLIIKLLGFMEQEIQPHIEEIISLAPSQIVNLGCAEGYYAVGMGTRIPSVPIIAIDIDSNAMKVTGDNAEANGIRDRFTMVDLNNIDSETEQAREINKHDLKDGAVWIVDIEGAEQNVLDPDLIPVLKNCFIIVETHDGTMQPIARRFSESHDISVVSSGGRNPNEDSILKNLPDDIKWPIMSEGRFGAQYWLAMIPKKERL